jgi:hypothetical protein
MQDRPTAPELLDAMAAQLFAEVREWVPRERRFQVLVLANLCTVVARELRVGIEPTLEDVALFEELLGLGGEDVAKAMVEKRDVERRNSTIAEHAEAAERALAAELAGAIRAGDLDDELSALIDRLREHVRRKLEVARPGYAD